MSTDKTRMALPPAAVSAYGERATAEQCRINPNRDCSHD